MVPTIDSGFTWGSSYWVWNPRLGHGSWLSALPCPELARGIRQVAITQLTKVSGSWEYTAENTALPGASLEDFMWEGAGF